MKHQENNLKKMFFNNSTSFRVVFITFTAVFVYSLISLYKIMTSTAPDYSIFYATTQDILHNTNPYTDKHLYTVDNYPPITNILFILLALLPYTVSQGIFIVLSFFTIPYIIFLSFQLINVRLKTSTFLIIYTLVLLSFPTKFTLGMGQVNLVAYLFFLLGVVMERKNYITRSGIVLAIAILLKPVLSFALLYFFLNKKVKVFTPLITTISLCMIGLLVIGKIDLIIFYFNHVFSRVLHNASQNGNEIYYNQGLIGFTSRLISNTFLRTMIDISIDIVLIIFTFFSFYQNRMGQNLQLALLLVVLLLIDPLSWQHHYVFLIFPFIVAFFALSRYSARSLSLLFLSYLLISSNIKYPTNITHFPNNILLSHVFLGALLLLYLLYTSTKKTKKQYVN